MLGSIGMPELIVIFGVLLLIFGPRQLPKMGRAMGDTIREWKAAGREIQKLHDEDLKG